MNAPAGIEPDKDRVAPVGCQCELNPCNDALPAPAPPHQADRFAHLQVGGLHAGRNRFVFKRHCSVGCRSATCPDFGEPFCHAARKISFFKISV